MSGIGLSVLIVTYNAGADIDTCLRLLRASRIDRPYEVILVDNASGDGTPERVAREFPWVRLVAEAENHGFAGGNALALGLARGAAILLLNPDAFLRDPDAVATALAHLDAHPEVGAVGPRLTFPDGAHQVGDAGYEPRPLTVLVHAAGLSGRFGLRGLYLSGRQARAALRAGGAPLDVDWLCGAFLLLRREAVDSIGGLSSPMFLYGEDVDWGCRLRDAGWRVAYLPGIAVVHLQGGSQAGSGSTRSARWLDGLAAVYRLRNSGRRLASPAFFSAPLRVGFALRALAYGIAGRLRRRPDLTAKAGDMRRFAGHLRSLR
ncbi:glycosyltransferase family 2 protein [Methylobacterium sp. NEAU 140]|uniref:glycosyltransferase family 2 protein n=1 Tax=Methylobacterium sp. NEAU 140 TaxID=3064945 RepID=UPI0027346D35|nr:glycosyltransferase family 2 protein [Methylobacterium sp. NEAU 140]MDP4021777.1 glycosyltransferase family 2 protein [Methylobacterium sp. NEAU 140]